MPSTHLDASLALPAPFPCCAIAFLFFSSSSASEARSSSSSLSSPNLAQLIQIHRPLPRPVPTSAPASGQEKIEALGTSNGPKLDLFLFKGAYSRSAEQAKFSEKKGFVLPFMQETKNHADHARSHNRRVFL